MKNLLKYIFLFAIACGMAGLYGSLHNQVSYTVSPEYFTQYKFPQFRLDGALPERVGAAIVGWRASWWMGGFMALILIVTAKIRKLPIHIRMMVRLFAMVTALIFALGIFALLISFFAISADSVAGGTNLGRGIQDPVAFLRAGMMHNAGYFAGLIGLLLGIGKLIKTA